MINLIMINQSLKVDTLYNKLIIYISLAVFALTGAKRSMFRSKIVPLNIDVMKSEYVNNSISRIVGGEEAVPHSHPYIAALFIYLRGEENYDGFCGGSIISKDFILTAAQCVDKAISVDVVLGAHNFFEDEEYQQRQTSREFNVHPQWNPNSISSPDIALIKLPRSLDFTYTVEPIKLPKYYNNLLNGRPAVISGWGTISDQSNEISPVLHAVHANVLALWFCKIFFLGLHGDNHICTRGRGGKGACYGDSGGPMVILNPYRPSTEESSPLSQSKKTLHGIVSFGFLYDCERGWPTVFTRVGAYIDWIRANADINYDDYE